MRIAAGVEYNGARFQGWQRQTGCRTVQECVEAAAARVANHALTVTVAGRTDARVHATGQVFHFDTPATRRDFQWLRGINSELPVDIRILWVRPVPDSFHARFSARSRRYRYVICNRPTAPALLAAHAAWFYQSLDVLRMQRAADYLVGEHDFSSFRAAGCQAKTARRTVHSLRVGRLGEWIWMDVHANAFLQHMVRNIAGTLVAIGAGERSVEWSRELLELRDRRAAAATAPAQGLYLTQVHYAPEHDLPAPRPPVRFW